MDLSQHAASERQSAYRLAAQVCIVTYDFECAQNLLPPFNDYLKSLPKAEIERSTYGSQLLLWVFERVMMGDYRSIPETVGIHFPAGVTNALADPIMYADLHLLASTRARMMSDFDASRDHLDRALGSIFTLQTESFDAPRLIVRAVGQLLHNYDTERALRLFTAAEPLLARIPEDSFLFVEYLQIRAALWGYLKSPDKVAADVHLFLIKLEKLQIKPWHKAYLKGLAGNELLGTLAMLGDHQATRDAISSHRSFPEKAAIRQRGYFNDRNEFMFAMAEEFASLLLGDTRDTGWGDLMTKPPRWHVMPEQVDELAAYGQAAVGLQHLRAGRKPEANKALIAAGKKRLASLQEIYRKSKFSAPLPHWSDQVLLEFAIAATLAGPEPADYDLIVGASVILRRSLQTSVDDALTNQALQSSEERRRIAQTLKGVEFQRADWERDQVVALARRVFDSSSARQSGEDRIATLTSADRLFRQLQKLRASVLTEETIGHVDGFTSLRSVQRALQPSEALIFYVPALHGAGKVCVRRDSVRTQFAVVDSPKLASAAATLREALTSTQPPSLELDSQFPVDEAMHLASVFFGGLEECMKVSPRIYLISPEGALDGIPPGVLLRERPPASARGGFNLRAAQWLAKEHAFVRTTSIAAFVATKQLSTSKRASLDYLGVGDPALKQRDVAGLAGATFVVRGSLPAAAGKLETLEELPEAAEELAAVSRFFSPSKSRVLQRDAATEERFRHEPLSEFDVLHFATHGLVKEELPGLPEPSLVFTPQLTGDKFDDGLLTSSQIAALPLRARLAILSACNTARYDARVADRGIQGLAASFAIAGVPAVVASLWPVDSALARNLMIGFAAEARGPKASPIADALAASLRKFLASDAPQPLMHPRFWASFVLVGDGAVTLGDDNISPRILRNFADTPAKTRGSIVAVTSFGRDMLAVESTATTGADPLLQRRELSGMTKGPRPLASGSGWLIASADDVVVSVGVKPAPGVTATASATAMLTRLSADGASLAETALAPVSGAPDLLALSVDSDASAFVLLRDASDRRQSKLIRVDRSGVILSQPILFARMAAGTQIDEAHLAPRGEDLLVAVGHRAAPPSREVVRANSFGVVVPCGARSETSFHVMKAADLSTRVSRHIDGFTLRASMSVRGGWLLVGDSQVDCNFERRAAAYFLSTDAGLRPLWLDSAPYQSSGRGIRSIPNGFEIVGYSERAVAINTNIARSRSAESAGTGEVVSGELFSVQVSPQGYEDDRDFVGAGVSVNPAGMVALNGRTAIYGAVGNSQLWLER